MGVAAVFNPGSPLDRIIESIRSLAAEHKPEFDVGFLSAGYAKRDPRSLARLLTAARRGGGALDGWSPPKGKAQVIGVTGAPGVGKSSFIARLSKLLRANGHKVAVVAVDPSSPVTGGALLGDRLRMMQGEGDAEFFVRSLSSGDAQGGLAPQCREVVDVMNGFGFDYILVETVGAGQGEIAIRELSDRVVLLLMPDSGDAVQFSKAGIMEIADCYVLNKSDLPGADATQAQLLSAIGESKPLFRVSSVREEGIDAVADWIGSAGAKS